MKFTISLFRKSESGATLVEYGVALILAILVGGGALTALGQDVDDAMGAACTEMQPSLGGTRTWTNSNLANC